MNDEKTSAELEVTPEMIEAGAAVLCRMTTYFGADEEVWAERIYRAMTSARRNIDLGTGSAALLRTGGDS
jgi:hypothetical protein